MPGEIVPPRNKKEFYEEFVRQDGQEVRDGNDELKVGTFVTIRNENIDYATICIVTRVYSDGTYEVSTERGGFEDRRFKRDQLIKFDPNMDVFVDKRKPGNA